MDDWGTSVWDTPTEAKSQLKFAQDAFDDEEDIVSKDFNAMSHFVDQKPLTDDDFGDDFGDFGDGDQISFEDNDMGEFQNEDAFQDFPPIPPATWEPLRLDPWPSPAELTTSVDNLLQIIWPLMSASTFLTDDNIRQVEGLNQVLVTPERYAN